jgi:5-bromo-4-chloroindolyl phosphate hydrolysis protein
MKEKLTKLINVKTIVTFVITAVFAVLALRESVTPEVTMGVVTTVIAFYFARITMLMPTSLIVVILRDDY